MAKAKKAGKRAKRAPRKPVGAARLGLDSLAARYAQLLMDPCNGPLTSAPFGDGTTGFVTRFEQDFLVNSSATDTGAYIGFIPSAALCYISPAAITTDSAAFVPSASAAIAPGNTFLAANASDIRCISACMQIYWPGTELNRSGIISMGNLNAKNVVLSGSTSALRSISQHVERMPNTFCELKWRPNNYDMQWTSIADEDGLAAIQDKRSAIIATAAGIPGSTGMRVRLVAVYEWLPNNSIGLNAPSGASSVSTSSFAQVIAKADSLGNWMYQGAYSTGQALGSLYRGVKAVQAVAYGTARMAPLLMG